MHRGGREHPRATQCLKKANPDLLAEAARTGFETRVAVTVPVALSGDLGLFVVAIDADGRHLTRSPSLSLRPAGGATALLWAAGGAVEKELGLREL